MRRVFSSLPKAEKNRVVNHNKASEEKGLPGDLHISQWESILQDFSYRCPFTGSYTISMDHFIPESTGHGGTYIGNVYPISPQMNASKNNANPFIWRETLSVREQKIFDEIVEYLANQHRLSVPDFREYVFWCFANQRTKKDIERDRLRGYHSSFELFIKEKTFRSKKERILSHFASQCGINEKDLFVHFADWCLQNEKPIHEKSFPLFIESLFSV